MSNFKVKDQCVVDCKYLDKYIVSIKDNFQKYNENDADNFCLLMLYFNASSLDVLSIYSRILMEEKYIPDSVCPFLKGMTKNRKDSIKKVGRCLVKYSQENWFLYGLLYMILRSPEDMMCFLDVDNYKGSDKFAKCVYDLSYVVESIFSSGFIKSQWRITDERLVKGIKCFMHEKLWNFMINCISIYEDVLFCCVGYYGNYYEYQGLIMEDTTTNMYLNYRVNVFLNCFENGAQRFVRDMKYENYKECVDALSNLKGCFSSVKSKHLLSNEFKSLHELINDIKELFMMRGESVGQKHYDRWFLNFTFNESYAMRILIFKIIQMMYA